MIAAIQFAITFGTATLRFRWAVFLFIFFLAFSPRSLGLIFGGGGLSLTYNRMTFPILLILFALARLFDRRPFEAPSPGLWQITPFLLMLALSMDKIFATLINGVMPLYALEAMLASTVAFAFFYNFSSPRVMKGITWAVLLSILLTMLVITGEKMINGPLHYSIANQVLLAEGLLETKTRGGQYRVQGIFDNPLSLSEYTIYALPVMLFLVVTVRGMMRRLAVVGLLGCAYIILATQARSGIVVGTMVCISFFSAYKWSTLTRASRILLIILFLIFGSYAIVSAFGLLFDLINDARNTDLFRHDENTISTYSRALQYYEISVALAERPLVGFGVLQNFSRSLDEVRLIDNYYLRTGLEAGVPGMVLFVLMQISLFWHTNRLARKSGRDRLSRAYYALCIGLLVGFAFKKLFLSQPENITFYFALMGTFLGAFTRLTNAREVEMEEVNPPVPGLG